MWYRDPTPEEELAAIALLRAQVNLFTHPSRSFYEETAEEKKIHEENLLTLLADADEGVMRVLLLYLEGYMRYRAAMEGKGEHFCGPAVARIFGRGHDRENAEISR